MYERNGGNWSFFLFLMSEIRIMKATYTGLIIFLAGFLFHSCSTDFDVIGEYQETTIVYGLMDQSEEYHYIRVNKSFLGSGNANDYALIRDSSEYDSVEGYVEEWLNNSATGRVWTIRDTVLSDREDGAFYGPEYTTYYFVEDNLNPSAEYRLFLDIEEGKQEVTASTLLINDFIFNFPPNTSPTATVSFATFDPSTQTFGYNVDYTVKWITGKNGKRYDLSFRFHWTDYTATDTIHRYVDWFAGSEVVTDNEAENGGLEIVKAVSGEAFFNNIANQVEADPNVLKRVVKGVDIMVGAASLDLYTYMIVNAPSTGLIQERPQYTNISIADDGQVRSGVGIFTSKYNKAIRNKKLQLNTLRALCNGEITGHLGFCSDTIIYSAESFYCN